MTREKLDAIISAIVKLRESATDEIAVETVDIYPEWQTDKTYTVGERIGYSGELYRCVQSHTSQADWTPDATPALWTEVAKPGEIPVWKQPTGAQDAYQNGDKVHYLGKGDPVYISTVDNNVWSPETYGWQVAE